MHTYEEMEKLIEELMSKYDDGRAFAGGVSEENIKRMEEILDVKLPEQYKWFLRKYGHGGFMGFEIFGFISNDSMPMVEYTQSYREKFKLGKEYIFIVNVDEYYYCLSCKTGQVFTGDVMTGPDTLKADTFLDYLYNELIESAEVWEEILEEEKKEDSQS